MWLCLFFHWSVEVTTYTDEKQLWSKSCYPYLSYDLWNWSSTASQSLREPRWEGHLTLPSAFSPAGVHSSSFLWLGCGEEIKLFFLNKGYKLKTWWSYRCYLGPPRGTCGLIVSIGWSEEPRDRLNVLLNDVLCIPWRHHIIINSA